MSFGLSTPSLACALPACPARLRISAQQVAQVDDQPMLSGQHRLQHCNFFTHGEAEPRLARCRKGEGALKPSRSYVGQGIGWVAACKPPWAYLTAIGIFSPRLRRRACYSRAKNCGPPSDAACSDSGVARSGRGSGTSGSEAPGFKALFSRSMLEGQCSAAGEAASTFALNWASVCGLSDGLLSELILLVRGGAPSPVFHPTAKTPRAAGRALAVNRRWIGTQDRHLKGPLTAGIWRQHQ